ncbi:Abscisic acid receptor PYL5 [Vitis vinifera]|uniref:Abscisic acid receptor PYL5 n=1 Tax=Vitis vinifera TaxID=29760 RepID=A0A438FAA1_VITVI|nr:Abscisic acid receptor PYL5 [Vitis vinifera]
MAITGPRVSVNGARVHSRGVARLVPLSLPIAVPDDVALRHLRTVKSNQFTSAYYREIDAPITTMWSILRRFDSPGENKPFIQFCHLASGNGEVGSIRHLVVHRNLPGKDSIERLDILDDNAYVTGFSIIGGDNNLKNYRSVTTLHTTANGEGTVVVESYVVDVHAGAITGGLPGLREYCDSLQHDHADS